MPDTRAALYIRVSTADQVDRDSLETQEERLRAYCVANQYSTTQVYRDAGLSAKDTDGRPAYEDLIRDCKARKVDVVLCTKLDRITRSIRDLIKLVESLAEYDVRFVVLDQNIDTSTAMGRFMTYLLGLLAQLEREVTAERVSIDMRHRASKGKWNGGVPPYGYRTVAKQLYIDPEEAANVQWIFETYLKTNSIRKTMSLLSDRGIRTRKGKLWAANSVHRILSNPTYVGKIWYGKRSTDPISGKLVKQHKETWLVADGEHEAIISQEQFEKAQELLQSNKKPTRKGQNYLLTGILRCGLCGGAMCGYTYRKKATGQTWSYYKCNNRVQKGKYACQGITLQRGMLEDFVVQSLEECSEDQEFLNDKARLLDRYKQQLAQVDTASGLQQIETRERAIKRQLATLLDKLQEGLIEDDDFSPRYKALKQELAELGPEATRLKDLASGGQTEYDLLQASLEEISNFKNRWEYLDDAGKAMRVRGIVKEIRATKERVEIDLFFKVLSRKDKGSSPRQA